MAKRIRRPDAGDEHATTNVPPSQPETASSRRHTTRDATAELRDTATDTFAAHAESPDRQPAEVWNAEAADESRHADSSERSGETHPSIDEDIRTRAYLRYVERGGGDGGEFEDWLEAERELKSLGDPEGPVDQG